MTHDRIVIDASICHGKPVIRGTRMPVTLIVGSLAGGMTFDEVEREYGLTASQRTTSEPRSGSSPSGCAGVVPFAVGLTMRFLLDANLPRSAATVAALAGDEAVHVSDLGLGDAADDAIAVYAKAQGLVLATRDLDFADIRLYPPDEHAGIVVLRLSEHAVASEICAVFERLLARREVVERLACHLAVVDDERVRVRPPLD